MPVIVDPDSGSVRRLLGALPPGCQSVDSIERLLPWLSQHSDEYVIVLGPNVRFDDAVTVCEGLRVSRPMMGVVLVRESFDTLYRDGEQSGCLLVLNLHPFLIGQPFRIGTLDAALGHVVRHPGVWSATGSEIIASFAKA